MEDDNIYWGKIAKKEKRNIFINHYNIANTGPENSSLTLYHSQDCIHNSTNKQVTRAKKKLKINKDECILITTSDQLQGVNFLNKLRENHKTEKTTISCNTYSLENNLKKNFRNKK